MAPAPPSPDTPATLTGSTGLRSFDAGSLVVRLVKLDTIGATTTSSPGSASSLTSTNRNSADTPPAGALAFASPGWKSSFGPALLAALGIIFVILLANRKTMSRGDSLRRHFNHRRFRRRRGK